MRTVLLAVPLLVSCAGNTTTAVESASPALPQPKDQTPEPRIEISAAQRKSFGPALQYVGETPFHIGHVENLLLFREERRQAQETVARWATALGFHVIDVSESEERLERAMVGKHPATGEACGPAVDRDMAVKRWYPTAGQLNVAIVCSPGCMMQLSVVLPGQGTEFFAAPFDPSQPWNIELAKRLGELIDNGGHVRHGHANNPVAPQNVVERAEGARDFYGTAWRGAEDLPADMAATCNADAGPAIVLADQTRCEPFPTTQLLTGVTDDALECVCSAFLPSVRGAHRRIAVAVPPYKRPAPALTKNGKTLSAFVTGLPNVPQLWMFPACRGSASDDCANVSNCFASRTASVETVTIPVTIGFDGKGKPTSADFEDTAGALREEERTCVRQRLMTARAACPEESVKVRANLWFSIL